MAGMCIQALFGQGQDDEDGTLCLAGGILVAEFLHSQQVKQPTIAPEVKERRRKGK